LVTKGDTAADFLQVEFELAKVPAEGGLGLVQNVTAARSSFIRTELNDFLMALEDEGVEPVAGRVETIVKAGPEEKPGELERKVIMKSPAVVGGAAFKGDRLVGWLDETETRGLLWVLNKVKSGVVVVRLPGGQGGVVGLELRGGRAKVSPELRDGKVTMNIEIRTSANIGDLGDSQPPLDPRIDPALIPALEERLAQAVKDEVSRALARAQVDLRSDIFGFGAAIHRSLPKEWHKLKGRWDEEFPRLEVNVKVKATILHPGRSARSVRPG
ncbi:MAG: Ger(x)C family spore germination C-terminal domain-containing protein, partial [Bacillota bacterium]